MSLALMDVRPPRVHTVRATNMRRNLITAIALLGVVLLVGCQQSQQNVAEKPTGVPGDAFQVGGADGGVYVELSKVASDPPDCYRGSIFEERSGTLWFRGTLKLRPATTPPIDIHNAALFSGWDGDALLLKDGRKLVAQR